MIDAGGGFHCSEDADSEGVEGKFYVWTPDEVGAVLGASRGERFCQIYDITAGGNFEGKSIPHLPRDLESWAESLSIEVDQLAGELRQDREELLAARAQRVAPGRDDKVLTAWNALAIRALSVAGAVLDQPRYLEAARRATEFVLAEMSLPDGRLLHAFRGGKAHLDAYVDDYAYLIEALIARFEADADPRSIETAVRLADMMLEHFQDAQAGGFFYTADDSETLITRTKDWHDGSLVSGNASAVMALLKLSRLCDRDDYRQAAERTFRVAAEILTEQAAACGAMLSALDQFYHDREQFVLAIAEPTQLAPTRRQLHSQYRPGTTLSWVMGDPAESEAVIPLNQQRGSIDGVPTLYRCRDFACDAPLVGDQAIEFLQRR
jgi:uncharacterized protein YyaL (SSP411 family)